MVGLLPICATTVIEPWQRERLPNFLEHFAMRLRRMPWLLKSIHPRAILAWRRAASPPWWSGQAAPDPLLHGRRERVS